MTSPQEVTSPAREAADGRASVALIGAGRMGQAHAQALVASGELELGAVVDPFDAARARAEELGARTFPDVGGLLQEMTPDLAVIATPSALHVDIVEQLAGAQIAILCEKPCGRTVEEARAIRDIVAKSGTPFQVGFWRRFVPELSALRQRFAAGEFGDLWFALATQWDEFPPPASFRDPAANGGIVIDMAVHEFDMLRWLTGQELSLGYATSSPVTSTDPVEGDPESASIVLELSGGATAVVNVGRRFPPGESLRVELVGNTGAEQLAYAPPSIVDELITNAIRAQVEGFARGLVTGDSSGATIDDAIAALEIAEGAAEALAAGAPR